MRHSLLPALGLALFAGHVSVSCSEASLAREVAPADRPNVVLISIDTLRPDRLSCYGGQRRTSPAIDALAARGTRFDNAFSPAPWTLPAHAAMLTGRYPSSLCPDPNDERLYRAGTLLATMFKAAEYKTGGVTGGALVAASFGVDEGFDFFTDKGKPNIAVEWLRRVREQGPFFLFFHTYVVHTPYRDDRYAKHLDGGRLTDIYKSGWDLHVDVACRAMELTDGEKRFLSALYDGGVARADEMVAQILAELRVLGVEDETIVVVTSDHGEEFWEHTGRGAYHGHTLYDELCRVPLIWVDPTIAAPPPLVADPVDLTDIVPTLAARIGLETPDPLDGQDLDLLLRTGRWDVERALFGEGLRHGPRRTSVRTAAGKLIVTDGTEQRGEGVEFPVPVRAPRELYLGEDVAEAVNAIASTPGLEHELYRLLEARMRARARRGPTEAAPALDPATIERMRALGYVK